MDEDLEILNEMAPLRAEANRLGGLGDPYEFSGDQVIDEERLAERLRDLLPEHHVSTFKGEKLDSHQVNLYLHGDRVACFLYFRPDDDVAKSMQAIGKALIEVSS